MSKYIILNAEGSIPMWKEVGSVIEMIVYIHLLKILMCPKADCFSSSRAALLRKPE